MKEHSSGGQEHTTGVTKNENDGTKVRTVDDVLKNEVRPFGWWQLTITMLAVWSDIPAAIFPVYGNSVPTFRCKMEDNIENLLLNGSGSFKHSSSMFQPKGPSSMLDNIYKFGFNEIASSIGPWDTNIDIIPDDVDLPEYGCFRYRRDWSNISTLDDIFKKSKTNESEKIEKCPYGYIYETDVYQYPSGIVIEWDLVCDKEWLAPLSTSLYMLGMVPGFWIGGWCADVLGRRPTALIFLVAQIIFGALCSFAPNVGFYSACRFVLGLSTVARSNVLIVLPVELTLAKYRFIVTSSTCVVQSFVNRALTALVAYFIPYWRWLHFAVIAPLIIGVLQFWFLPESPRWLLGQERREEASLVLYRGYLMNRHKFCCKKSDNNDNDDLLLTLKDFESFFINTDENQPNNIIRDMQTDRDDFFTSVAPVQKHFDCGKYMCSFKSIYNGIRKPYQTRLLVRISLISTFLFTAQTACVFGVLLYARIIRSYVYLVAFINNLTGIPGAVLSSILYSRLHHRKKPLMVVYFCAFLSLAIGGVYAWMNPDSNDILLTVCSNLGLILTTAITNMLLSYIPELYPSCIRSQGLGNAAGLGRLGAVLGTFINELDTEIAHGTPLVFYALLLLLAFVSLIFLPDTTGENLPDKIDITKKNNNKNKKDNVSG